MKLQGTILIAMSGAMLLVAQADNPKQGQKAPADPAAQTQGTADADKEIMRRIRKAVGSDKALSGEARRVRVTAEGGKVTLRGVVQTEEEKAKITEMAASVAGAGNVTNELEIVKKGQ